MWMWFKKYIFFRIIKKLFRIFDNLNITRVILFQNADLQWRAVSHIGEDQDARDDERSGRSVAEAVSANNQSGKNMEF